MVTQKAREPEANTGLKYLVNVLFCLQESAEVSLRKKEPVLLHCRPKDGIK